MLLYLVRHGDPIYETDSLTPRGRLQAEAVGKRMADAGIQRIFSSPMGRARETAAPACRLLGLECGIEPWAHELEDERYTHFPDGKKKSVTFVQNTYFREKGNQDLSYDQSLGCQGLNDTGMAGAVQVIEAGGKDFLERLGYREENGVYRILRPNEEKVALFCHYGLERTWLSILLHLPLHMVFASFKVTHTGVTVLEFRNNANGVTAPTVLCFSDMSHLYAEGLDMKHDNSVDL